MARLFILLSALLLIAGAPAPGSGPAAAETFRSDRITVETMGTGPDVILIPGLASTPEVWRPTARRLKDRYRVHLIGLRGFGEAEAGANARGSVAAPVAAEIARYIAEQRLERPAVVGHSMGGQIALRLAALTPDRIGRLMVVDSSPFFPALVSPGATTGDVEPLAQLTYQALRLLGDDALRQQGDFLSQQLGGASDILFGALGWQGGDRRVLAQALYEAMTADLRHRLPLITAPVTVVYGLNGSEAGSRAQIERAFRDGYGGLPRPPVYAPVEGARHMVMIDQPDRFQRALERFLR